MNTIIANEGYYLTQVDDVEILERIYVKKISGAADNLETKWRQASKEEKEEFDLKRKELEELE